MQDDDESDFAGLGEVGYMSEQLSSEALFWRLVYHLRLSLSEVDSWSLSEMRLASGYMEMQNDYKRIWSTYYDLKREGVVE